jgi:hypothetical protein
VDLIAKAGLIFEQGSKKSKKSSEYQHFKEMLVNAVQSETSPVCAINADEIAGVVGVGKETICDITAANCNGSV